MWIAYPVSFIEKSLSASWSKVEHDFFRAAPDVSRSFSVYGRPGNNVSISYRLKSPNAPVTEGHLYSMRGIGSVAILKFGPDAPKALARPNVRLPKPLFSLLCLAD
jgi:hypothetical protein